MGRDRFVHVDAGTRPTTDAHGHDDNGFPLTATEKIVYDSLKRGGWEVRKHGWPDFIASKGKLVRFIEVKSKTDRLRASQLANHRLLRRAGIKVDVYEI